MSPLKSLLATTAVLGCVLATKPAYSAEITELIYGHEGGICIVYSNGVRSLIKEETRVSLSDGSEIVLDGRGQKIALMQGGNAIALQSQQSLVLADGSRVRISGDSNLSQAVSAGAQAPQQSDLDWDALAQKKIRSIEFKDFNNIVITFSDRTQSLIRKGDAVVLHDGSRITLAENGAVRYFGRDGRVLDVPQRADFKFADGRKFEVSVSSKLVRISKGEQPTFLQRLFEPRALPQVAGVSVAPNGDAIVKYANGQHELQRGFHSIVLSDSSRLVRSTGGELMHVRGGEKPAAIARASETELAVGPAKIQIARMSRAQFESSAAVLGLVQREASAGAPAPTRATQVAAETQVATDTKVSTETKGTAGTDTKGTAGTETKGSTDTKGTGAETQGSTGTETKGSADIKGTAGTETKGSTETKGTGAETQGTAGTETKGTAGTETKGTAGTATKVSTGTDAKSSTETQESTGLTKVSTGVVSKVSGTESKGSTSLEAQTATSTETKGTSGEASKVSSEASKVSTTETTELSKKSK